MCLTRDKWVEHKNGTWAILREVPVRYSAKHPATTCAFIFTLRWLDVPAATVHIDGNGLLRCGHEE